MTALRDPGGSPPSPPIVATAVRRRRRRIVAAALAPLLIGFAVLTARLFVFPDLPPVPDRADAIVDLGGPGNRRAVALDLARDGHAPVVAVSVSIAELNTSWCDSGHRDGVRVICFHAEPFTTRGEARTIADLAREHGWRSIILVTSTDQAWRAMVRVSRCFDGEIAVATAKLPWYRWPVQIVYQWGATIKAFTYETGC